jgi:putative phage-type endonuclease
MKNQVEKQAFLERRKSGLGGSDMGAVMGLSKWRTPLDIYNDKTSDTIDLTPNDILDLSSYLEDYTARKYADLTGYTVKRYNAELEHPKYPFLKGNIDRRISKFSGDINLGILECKAVSTYNFRKIEQYGLPDEYILQMQFYFAVSNYRYVWGEFAVLNRDNGKLLIIPVQPDKELGKALIDAGKNFWENHVIPKIPPLDNVDAEKINLPKVEGKLVNMSDNSKLNNLLNQYREYNDLKIQAESLVEDVKKEIAEVVKDKQAVECNSIKIYNITSTRNTFDSQKFKKDNPTEFEKYIKQTVTNSMRIFLSNNQ